MARTHRKPKYLKRNDTPKGYNKDNKKCACSWCEEVNNAKKREE